MQRNLSQVGAYIGRVTPEPAVSGSDEPRNRQAPARVAWRELAAQQHGLIARRQAASVGLTNDAFTRLTLNHLTRVHRGVFRVAGTPQGFAQQVLAACLAAGPGSAASGACAARLLGIDGPGSAPVEIESPRRVSLDGVCAHPRIRIPSADIRVVDGVPTAGPFWTLLRLPRDGRSQPSRSLSTASCGVA